MNETKLDQEFFAELSAFNVSALKEGFAFKPSRIVKDKNYRCNVLAIVASKGSEALNASAIQFNDRCDNLRAEHETA